MSGPARKRPLFGHTVRKILFDYPDLKYDGTAASCLVCDVRLFWNLNLWKRHVTNPRHIKNRKNQIRYARFIFDLIFMLTACSLPFSVVRKQSFRMFWKKYNQNWRLPTHGLRLQRLRERIENDTRRELRKKNLWLSIDEMPDIKKFSVVNIFVRILSPNGSSAPYLLASKRIKRGSEQAIEQILKQTLKKFGISTDQVLMLVTDGAPSLVKLGQSLQSTFPNLLYFTCLLHAFHLVSEAIRKCYQNVDQLILETRIVFDPPKQLQKFQKSCPGIPEPPQIHFKRQNTWLEAVFYYSEYYDQIKSVVLQLDSQKSQAVRNCQQHFKDPQVQTDLQKICESCVEIAEVIHKLRTSSLSLIDTFKTITSVETELQNLTCNSQNNFVDCFQTALNQNPDYTKLWTIHGKCQYNEPLDEWEKCLLFASLTSIDTETSFSWYRNILSPQRTSLKDVMVETYAMMQVYNGTN